MPADLEKILSRYLESVPVIDKMSEKKELALQGLTGSLRTLFLLHLRKQSGRSMLVCVPEREDAELLLDEIEALDPRSCPQFFPGGRDPLESPLTLNPVRSGLQMRSLREMINRCTGIIVVTPHGLAQPVPSPNVIKKKLITVRQGATFNLSDLVEILIDYGYTREIVAERAGEISLRGGILDIFPFTGEEPHRIEFFGNEVESMRIYDPETQLSTEKGERLDILPSPLMWRDMDGTIVDYLPRGAVLFFQDPGVIEGEIKRLSESGEKLRPFRECAGRGNEFGKLYYYSFSAPKDAIDVGGKIAPLLGKTAGQMRETLQKQALAGKTSIITARSEDQVRRIKHFLDLEDEPLPALQIHSFNLRQGFFLPAKNLLVYSVDELFQRRRLGRVRRHFKMGVPIRELTSLKSGDFVVHIDHGIGRYCRLEKITVGGAERECLTIEYQGGDRLYVPVDKMERVQKYSGREGVVPALSTLGSGSWEKNKKKTKESMKKIAQDLIDLYSKRKIIPGFAYPSQTEWESQLEDTFPYDETLDQSRAIQEVKGDMEVAKPMDRLICGDVGFGKTEVAIRAAFKAVNAGKQVAVLVPTTILSQQHVETFRQRLSYFPVQIDELSRFRTPKEQKETLRRLENGEIDIIIGTHSLLSHGVTFKELGLLIIDEEQRFGVRHKEKLKSIKENVDVITLSATPIPRTLQFSVMGLRDMSVINTPPKERRPIITEIAPFGEDIIKEAIEHEIGRDGQVFFVHNLIKSIDAVAEMVRRLVPGLRLAVAHGRMHAKDLEEVMHRFGQGDFDCLVSTMIIGSGVDIPLVNTLIVNRADRMGLSQLYQLRGRVGRSDRQAFAYLLTPPFHLLSFESMKRLRTVEELTELGSGFQIALRDLEIRGAGNLLGTRQSGTIDMLGFDLYTKLLNEALSELQKELGEQKTASIVQIDCQVDLNRDAFIPADYVAEEGLRVNLYHRLTGLPTEKELDAFYQELQDRFGSIPDPAVNLLEMARIRLLGGRMGIKRILFREKDVLIFFSEAWLESFISPELLSERLRFMIDSSPVTIRFLQKKTFGLRLVTEERDQIELMKKVLHSWI